MNRAVIVSLWIVTLVVLGYLIWPEAPSSSVNAAQSITFVGNITPACDWKAGRCTLPNAPVNGSLLLVDSGLVLTQNVDYALNGNVISFRPRPAGLLTAWYAR